MAPLGSPCRYRPPTKVILVQDGPRNNNQPSKIGDIWVHTQLLSATRVKISPTKKRTNSKLQQRLLQFPSGRKIYHRKQSHRGVSALNCKYVVSKIWLRTLGIHFQRRSFGLVPDKLVLITNGNQSEVGILLVYFIQVKNHVLCSLGSLYFYATWRYR